MNDDLYLETLVVKYLREGLDVEEMEWIFKQAKRNRSLEKWSKKQTERVPELEQQNERYREALEFYANEETYKTTISTPPTNEYQQPIEPIFKTVPIIYYDCGKEARKALLMKGRINNE